MLTRIRVKGFKNLVDVEVRLGPFTCIAGPNGVGKSNIFDAIQFISLLADKPFIEAASLVRGGEEDIASLFTASGNDEIHLECDVLIPGRGKDDFGQEARATNTFLNYLIVLRLERDPVGGGRSVIRLSREELSYIPKGNSRKRLGFPFHADWLNSAVAKSNRRTTFISTQGKQGRRPSLVTLQSDRMRSSGRSKRGGGKPTYFPAETLPRTVLSSAQNAEETRTAVLLRQEMRQWRQLQLEPSALRKPDEFESPQQVAASGAHVPATLLRLSSNTPDPDAIFADVANRLAELVDGIRDVRVLKDDGRKLIKLMMTDLTGLELPASSLSDGTLRFIALAVLERDPEATGVLCLEEPENGIHPTRVKAMLRLLQDMAVDPFFSLDDENPLRQVIATTHSPVVVANASPSDIVFARATRHMLMEDGVQGLEVSGLDHSWRARADGRTTSKGAILAYLSTILPSAAEDDEKESEHPRRVADIARDQLQLSFYGRIPEQ